MTPRFSGRELSTAIIVLSPGRRPLGFLLPRSGLERSDFVPWHETDMSAALHSVCFRGQSGERHRRGFVTMELARHVIPKELASGKATSKLDYVEAPAH